MKNDIRDTKNDVIERNIVLISKIYESFEVLEETLGGLKLEEPLFIINAAKKSFANSVYNSIKGNDLYKAHFKN